MIANKNKSPLSCLLADKQGYSFSWPPLPQLGLLYSLVIHVCPPYSITLSFDIILMERKISFYQVHDPMNVKISERWKIYMILYSYPQFSLENIDYRRDYKIYINRRLYMYI